MRRRGRWLPPLLSLLAGLLAAAQTSASCRPQESSINAGGDPWGGATLAQAGLASASDHTDASFVSAYPPPGEVQGIVFPDKNDLNWNPEKSVGTYAVYRDAGVRARLVPSGHRPKPSA